jgi:DNA (cytosine-5)-methyltransferase 1
LFSEIGYKAEGRILQSQHYGVPQKRKRIIIICIRSDLPFSPSDLYPQPITPYEDMQISAFDAISDLETIECSDDAEYVDVQSGSTYLKYLKGDISISEYISMIYDQSSRNESILTRKLTNATANSQLPLFDL